MYTDAPNKRCFSWSNDVPQLRLEGMLIVLVTQRTSCYHFGKYDCTRKQHTLKAVVKFSRNIEYIHVKLLTPKALTISPKAATETSTAGIRD